MSCIVPVIKIPYILCPVTEYDYTLSNSSIEDNYIHDHEVVKSIINGHKSIISNGNFYEGTIIVRGVGNSLLGDYQDLQGNVVRLWPYGTGVVTTGKYYPYVDVIISEVLPFHDQQQHWRDAVLISFVSQDPYTPALATDDGLPQE